ncbi:hypothetical protein FSARC_10184 [Fusarium sarcochroum]|uniref:Uncharacterized protein n=1 Tax=Fusarium sarcochroum TaxID=1208366 RepID=A0A8H4TPE2_9HYPO|nr:hypothetical protein FSARC_10184 [Fusarium sarcochroum]
MLEPVPRLTTKEYTWIRTRAPAHQERRVFMIICRKAVSTKPMGHAHTASMERRQTRSPTLASSKSLVLANVQLKASYIATKLMLVRQAVTSLKEQSVTGLRKPTHFLKKHWAAHIENGHISLMLSWSSYAQICHIYPLTRLLRHKRRDVKDRVAKVSLKIPVTGRPTQSLLPGSGYLVYGPHRFPISNDTHNTQDEHESSNHYIIEPRLTSEVLDESNIAETNLLIQDWPHVQKHPDICGWIRKLFWVIDQPMLILTLLIPGVPPSSPYLDAVFSTLSIQLFMLAHAMQILEFAPVNYSNHQEISYRRRYRKQFLLEFPIALDHEKLEAKQLEKTRLQEEINNEDEPDRPGAMGERVPAEGAAIFLDDNGDGLPAIQILSHLYRRCC